LLISAGLPEADQIRSQAVKILTEAGELRPYDIKSLTILINNAARLGHTEGLISLGQKSIKASPNDIVVYKNIANLWWDASQQYLEAGQEDTAIEFAHQIQILKRACRIKLQELT
jgi:tetratricopeptide (TPR) repeat protein